MISRLYLVILNEGEAAAQNVNVTREKRSRGNLGRDGWEAQARRSVSCLLISRSTPRCFTPCRQRDGDQRWKTAVGFGPD